MQTLYVGSHYINGETTHVIVSGPEKRLDIIDVVFTTYADGVRARTYVAWQQAYEYWLKAGQPSVEGVAIKNPGGATNVGFANWRQWNRADGSVERWVVEVGTSHGVGLIYTPTDLAGARAATEELNDRLFPERARYCHECEAFLGRTAGLACPKCVLRVSIR